MSHSLYRQSGSSVIVRLSGCAAVLAGSFFGSLFLIDKYESGSILNETRRGADVWIRFDFEACESNRTGTLICGIPYRAHYERATNRWTVTGPSTSQTANLTDSYTNAPNSAGYISVWGIVGSFDETGNLKFKGVSVGAVRINRLDGLRYLLLGF